jgi:hypothetical protein
MFWSVNPVRVGSTEQELAGRGGLREGRGGKESNEQYH